jgi:hypothetical protein
VTVRRLAIVAILAVCLGGPIGELFDHWDQTAQDGNDTEANVVIAALCVGLALSVAGIVVARIRAISLRSQLHIRVAVRVRFAAPAFAIPIPTSSPPTPLRV